MIYLAIIALLAIGIIYNLIKATEIQIPAKVLNTSYISLGIIGVVLFGMSAYFLEHNMYNYYVSVMVVLFTYSGMRVKGINKKGVLTNSLLTFLAKFVPWGKITAMKFEFNHDELIDVVFSTPLTAFRQSYDLKFEVRLIKIKKELKLD